MGASTTDGSEDPSARTSVTQGRPKLIVHVVGALDVGGLENGLVNLVNTLDPNRMRHVIIALRHVSTFSARISNDGVRIFEINKRGGTDVAAYARVFRILKDLRPDVLHTRNLGTLDIQLLGWLLKVPLRIHGEHGWDVHDKQGTSTKYRIIRRLLKPFVSRYVGVSTEICRWMQQDIGIEAGRIVHISNGVNTELFSPGTCDSANRTSNRALVIGTVSRLNEIKDPFNIVRAFAFLVRNSDIPCVLEIVGDGPLMEDVRRLVSELRLNDHVILHGSSDDVPSLVRRFDVFALGSKREGVSNTILECMAAGLPIVATATGGNIDLVKPGFGTLVPPMDSQALGEALLNYVADPVLRRQHGNAARTEAVNLHSLANMVNRYQDLYLGA